MGIKGQEGGGGPKALRLKGGGGVMIFAQFELSLVSPGLLCPGIIAGFSEPMGGGGKGFAESKGDCRSLLCPRMNTEFAESRSDNKGLLCPGIIAGFAESRGNNRGLLCPVFIAGFAESRGDNRGLLCPGIIAGIAESSGNR